MNEKVQSILSYSNLLWQTNSKTLKKNTYNSKENYRNKNFFDSMGRDAHYRYIVILKRNSNTHWKMYK